MGNFVANILEIEQLFVQHKIYILNKLGAG